MVQRQPPQLGSEVARRSVLASVEAVAVAAVAVAAVKVAAVALVEAVVVAAVVVAAVAVVAVGESVVAVARSLSLTCWGSEVSANERERLPALGRASTLR